MIKKEHAVHALRDKHGKSLRRAEYKVDEAIENATTVPVSVYIGEPLSPDACRVLVAIYEVAGWRAEFDTVTDTLILR